MNKEKVGGQVKLARALYSQKIGRKFTQQDLSEKINVSRSYIGDIESGRTYPSVVVLSQIAQSCDLPVDFFINYQSHNSNVKQNDNFTFNETLSVYEIDNLIKIPVLGVIRAGDPILAEQNIIGFEYLPEDIAKGGKIFGLKVTGDSMDNAKIGNGDVVLIREQSDVENGEIAAVLVNGENATVKKFYKSNKMITLMPDSTNKENQPIFIDSEKVPVKVLGKVIKIIVNI